MIKKRIFLAALFCLFIFLYRGNILGFALEGFLSKTLSDLFGMRVTISGLFADPVTGRVKASRVTFWNQPEFAKAPHLDLRGMEFDLDFRALFHQRIILQRLDLYRPFYFIDRIATPNGPTNNAVAWVDYMEAHASKDPDPSPTPWKFEMHHAAIHDGDFVIHDRSRKEGERKFVWRQINGYLADFRWPAEEPAVLNQRVQLQGLFGEKYPAPFWIEGAANFATSQVNFDLRGEVRNGNVLDYSWFWTGSPVDIKEGDYDLTMHVRDFKRNLESTNILEIKSIKARPGPATADKVWGLPVMGFIGFIQSQKTIRLNVPVNGYIKDPTFEFSQAFREAFQGALEKHVTNGFNAVKENTLKIAAGTTELVTTAPGKVAEGIEKISETVKKQVAV